MPLYVARKRSRSDAQIAAATSGWQQHDELFYKFGFDVSLPRFLQNEDRAAWLRMLGAELPEHHRATDAALSWYASAAGRRKDYDYQYRNRECNCCD